MRTFIVLALLSLWSACTPKTNNYSEKVVVKVNSDTLDAKSFADELVFKLKSFDPVVARKASVINTAKKQIINDFIVVSALRSWASVHSIDVSKEELEQQTRLAIGEYPDKKSFIEALAKEGLGFEKWLDRQRTTMLQQKVIRNLSKNLPEPTASEIKNYYNQHKARYSHKKMIKLSQIVSDSEAAAKKVRAELKKNNLPFEEAARKYSIAPEAKQNGLVGWVEEGTLEVFDKAFALRKGRISDVHQSPYGWHIFRIEDKKPEKTKSLNDVQGSIVKTMKTQREQAIFTDWLDSQMRQSRVKIDEELLSAISVETKEKL